MRSLMVTVEIQDPSGEPITTLELYEDIYRHMQIQAELNGVTVQEHIIGIVVNHARQIIADAETT